MTMVNAYQTPELRRLKYAFARAMGFTPKQAQIYRDYTKPKLVQNIYFKLFAKGDEIMENHEYAKERKEIMLKLKDTLKKTDELIEERRKLHRRIQELDDEFIRPNKRTT